MSTKHTPAPWWVEESGVRDRGGYIAFTPTATRYPDQEERFVKETAERAANKALIAAAPELLEALLDVMFRHVPFSDKSAYAEKARAAIAKATGEAAS